MQEKRCSLIKKRKVVLWEAGINRLILYKISNLLLWKTILQKSSQQQQLASSRYQRIQPLVKSHSNTCLWSEFNAQFCRNWIKFPFCMKRCTTTTKLKTLRMINKACKSFCFAFQSWLYIKLWSYLSCFQDDCFFRWHYALHWWEEHRKLCRFSLWFHFPP